MKDIHKSVIALSLLGLSLSSHAGIANGKVKVLKLDVQNKILMVRVMNDQGQSGLSEPPSCATWHHHLAVKYTGTEEQKALMTLLTTAQASSANVRIVGKNTCVAGTNAEEIMDVELSVR